MGFKCALRTVAQPRADDTLPLPLMTVAAPDSIHGNEQLCVPFKPRLLRPFSTTQVLRSVRAIHGSPGRRLTGTSGLNSPNARHETPHLQPSGGNKIDPHDIGISLWIETRFMGRALSTSSATWHTSLRVEETSSADPLHG